MTAPRMFEHLVGLTGDAATGKDTVAKVFERFGYSHVSSSDLVREEIHGRGLTPSRELQTAVANEMRQRHGLGYWIDRSLDRAGHAESVVISGLYSPGEGRYLMRQHGGLIVALVAGQEDDVEARYARVRHRASGSRDDLDHEQFLAAYQRENGGLQEHETNIATLAAMATFTIYHSEGIERLEEQAAQVAAMIGETA